MSDEMAGYYCIVRDGAALGRPDEWLRIYTKRSAKEAHQFVRNHALTLDSTVQVVMVLPKWGKPRKTWLQKSVTVVIEGD